ncbi:MAG TPA: S8 family serine peptidase [Pyrinomonadaceae bacterium]|nr:S8 family serine peptidase [Pyrinomonadaceae bacterium]
MSVDEQEFLATMSGYFKPRHNWREATGVGVTVAVIDSGIETDHPDIAGKTIESVEARVEASIKVLGAGGLGVGQGFLAGLEYAIKKKYKVINLSLGTTKPQFFAPLHDMLDRAYQAGCIVVAAANNLPQPSFPSVFSSSLISVIKSEATDPLKFGFHYGEVIELTAPGVNVRTAWLDKGHRNLTGNSFACPHITGIVARFVEGYPNLTPFQVKSALYAIARENTPE